MEVVMNDRRRDLVVAVLALAGAVFAVLQAAVVPALPDIDRALRAGPSSGASILTVNLLATAVLTPVTSCNVARFVLTQPDPGQVGHALR
jgi:hypothetical protein